MSDDGCGLWGLGATARPKKSTSGCRTQTQQQSDEKDEVKQEVSNALSSITRSISVNNHTHSLSLSLALFPSCLHRGLWPSGFLLASFLPSRGNYYNSSRLSADRLLHSGSTSRHQLTPTCVRSTVTTPWTYSRVYNSKHVTGSGNLSSVFFFFCAVLRKTKHTSWLSNFSSNIEVEGIQRSLHDSVTTRWPFPVVVKPPQTITPPPPCLTAGVRYLCQYIVFGFSQKYVVLPNRQHFTMKVCQMIILKN